MTLQTWGQKTQNWGAMDPFLRVVETLGTGMSKHEFRHRFTLWVNMVAQGRGEAIALDMSGLSKANNIRGLIPISALRTMRAAGQSIKGHLG